MDADTVTGASSDELKGSIAVLGSEMEQWGCPRCGYRSGHSTLSVGSCATWHCDECHYDCILLAEGLTMSTIGVGTGIKDDFVYPELQEHPRKGTQKHGRPDTRPEEGGEYFHSRGIGMDSGLRCFVCMSKPTQHFLDNIAAFVTTGDAGQRIVAMFDSFRGGARLDFRESSPDHVQVKIGACPRHRPNLENLQTACEDGRITAERITEAALA